MRLFLKFGALIIILLGFFGDKSIDFLILGWLIMIYSEVIRLD